MNMQEELAKLNTLAEKQAFFLNDMLKHFNKSNRGVKTGSTYSCSYVNGCAVGRWLDPVLANEMDELPGDTGMSVIPVFNMLPDWLQELTQNFLQHIQAIHDTHDFWDACGYTRSAKRSINDVITKFKLIGVNV